MKAKVFPFREGCYGNVVWARRDRGGVYYSYSQFAMYGGRFPASHPIAPGEAFATGLPSEYGAGGQLQAFRARGYMASCFPEGDGLAFKPLRNQTAEQCLTDIRETLTALEVEWGVAPVAA